MQPEFVNGESAWDSVNKCKVVVCMDVLEGEEYLVFPAKEKYGVLYSVEKDNLKALQYSNGDKL